jgi:hypothetical protein
MAIDNNPLKQFFRRPGLFLTLPSGGDYPDNVLIKTEAGEIPIFPMTAIDDITIKTPDALFNGQAVADVIRSCVPNVLDPWKISSVDLDAILIAIKAASSTGDMEISTTCPSCSETELYKLNLAQLLVRIKSGDYSTEMQIDNLFVKFRPLTFKEINQISLEQFNMQKLFIEIESTQDDTLKMEKSKEALKTIASTTMSALALTIDHVRTPNNDIVTDKNFILEFLRNCDKMSFDAIRDQQGKLKEQSDMKPLGVECPHCSHKYEQQFTLNMSDFFA